MPVNRVVAKIRFTAHEPLRERRPAEITNRLERLLPMNRCRLFTPEAFALFQRATTELDRFDGLTHWGASNNWRTRQHRRGEERRQESGDRIQELQEFRSCRMVRWFELILFFREGWFWLRPDFSCI